MRDQVSIIGCGPSAMMIALACHQAEVPFTIYAPKQKSVISGAQYLHREIPNVTDQERFTWHAIRYIRRGTEEGYKEKIYGAGYVGPCSWSLFPDVVKAWPLIAIYDALWELFHDRIVDRKVNLEDVISMSWDTLTFNTAPLPSLMPDAHYQTELVFIAENKHSVMPNTIIYDGTEETAWYRASELFGHGSIEFPSRGNAQESRRQWMAKMIRKPLSTDATIPGVILSGRYGRWQKGVLVDESYFQAREAIHEHLGISI